jgi:surface antigen
VTDNEFPETPRGPLEESDAIAQSALVSTSSAPGFSSRREMREAGGYGPAEPRAALAPRAKKVRKRRIRARDAVRSAASASDRPRWRRRLSSAGVMTVVVGLFASLTLPAFAENNPLARTSGPVDAQTFEITAASTDASAFIRDGYETTSAADLRRVYADAIRQQNLAAYLASGARAMGDDYPWPDALSRPQGGGLSPLRYYYRECVDFVAWRINRDAGSFGAPFKYDWATLAPSSAYGWKRAWENNGWVTSSVPIAGAVAWTPGGNHVAYVSGVLADGSVALEEYNYSVDHGYSQRVIQPGEAYYLYPPG